MEPILEDPAFAAYESLAPFYNSFTHAYRYSEWLGNIEAILLEHGLAGSRLLDVACGTGNSFLPMLARGYEVTGCDLSPAMVELARAAAAGTDTEVVVADMRDLPLLGRFDVVTCIDDAFNYLLSDDELATAFEGVARNLRPGGLFAFDLNTLGGYRHHMRDAAMEVDGAFLCWRANGDATAIGPRTSFSAVIEVFATDDGACWQRYSSQHVQRHHPPELVARLLAEAGFELLERRGQITGACLEPVGDEELHRKFDYFARRLPSSGPAWPRGGDDA
jgi:SAM-dependent methyltransferase